jgi:hypothetical protein
MTETKANSLGSFKLIGRKEYGDILSFTNIANTNIDTVNTLRTDGVKGIA